MKSMNRTAKIMMKKPFRSFCSNSKKVLSLQNVHKVVFGRGKKKSNFLKTKTLFLLSMSRIKKSRRFRFPIFFQLSMGSSAKESSNTFNTSNKRNALCYLFRKGNKVKKCNLSETIRKNSKYSLTTSNIMSRFSKPCDKPSLISVGQVGYFSFYFC